MVQFHLLIKLHFHLLPPNTLNARTTSSALPGPVPSIVTICISINAFLFREALSMEYMHVLSHHVSIFHCIVNNETQQMYNNVPVLIQ